MNATVRELWALGGYINAGSPCCENDETVKREYGRVPLETLVVYRPSVALGSPIRAGRGTADKLFEGL